MLLVQSIGFPPIANAEQQKKNINEEYAVILHRRLGLPEKAIEVYRGFLKSQKPFFFTGFTSTSYDKEVALKFTHQATQRQGQVPVLFVMDVKHGGGMWKASLHDGSLSAFPEEKEYLIAMIGWEITGIKQEPQKLGTDRKSTRLNSSHW
mgnify:CR=1 FL=1